MVNNASKNPCLPPPQAHRSGRRSASMAGISISENTARPRAGKSTAEPIAEWLTARGGTQDERPQPIRPSRFSRSPRSILAFWRHAQTALPASRRHPLGRAGQHQGRSPAAPLALRGDLSEGLRPLALRAVRDEMVRSGLARTSVNARVNRIRRAFKWAASVELIPVSVVQALATVAGLQAGRTDARETDPIGPVPLEVVEKTLPFLSRPVPGWSGSNS